MDSSNLLNGLFKKIGSENNFVDGNGGGHTQLTPHLALVVSILYMMVADGEISDQETSQLQSVVGNDDAVLKRALQYVATTKIEQFLADAPSVLDSQDSLCVLMNVCDSIMADGELAELELNLFQRMTNALGHSKKSFRSYFNAISIKNKKSVLGSFENFIESKQLTPQLAMAVAILYMMSVDGSMAEEEIGQLNVVIGRSDGLLKAALKYVRSIKFQQFVSEAAALLNTAQKLCILMNVCDSMMSDGEVASIEMDLFRRMLTAFNFSEEKFQPYFNILSRKNEKPEKIKDEDDGAALIPAHFKKVEEDGVIFDRKILQNEDKLNAPGEIDSEMVEGDEVNGPTERSELGVIINRKMQDNINRMSESIVGKNGIQDITNNAISSADNEEHGLREHNDKNSIAPAKDALNVSVHYLESGNEKDSVHYLDKDGAQTSVHYLDDDTSSSSVHYLDKATDSGAVDEDIHHPGLQAGAKQKQSTRNKSKSGPAKHRAIKDHRTLIPAKAGRGKDASPSDLRVIEDSESESDASPLEMRMTIVQTRTIEISETLDKLDTVSASQFNKRGLILSTIKFSPAPTKTTTTTSTTSTTSTTTAISTTASASAIVYSKADVVSTHAIVVNNPISILQKEEFLVSANNSALENNESAVSMQGIKLKIAFLFSALIIAHGFSSFGESTAQSDLIQKGSLATNANVSLQAVATQQTLYKLAADELDASQAKRESLGIEQPESEKSKFADYLKKIEEQESSPATGEGRKELAAARKAHEEVAAMDVKMIQWFVLSKAILLLGIGLALCGFFFKSRFIFYGASLSAVLGTLLTLNGFFLFM